MFWHDFYVNLSVIKIIGETIANFLASCLLPLAKAALISIPAAIVVVSLVAGGTSVNLYDANRMLAHKYNPRANHYHRNNMRPIDWDSSLLGLQKHSNLM